MAGGAVVLELIEGADTVGSKATDQAKKNKSYSVLMQGQQTKKQEPSPPSAQRQS